MKILDVKVDEVNAVMTLVEDRGERMLVTSSICEGFSIVPTFVFATEDLVEVKL